MIQSRLVILALLLIPTVGSAQSVQVTSDRTTMYMGETLRLSIVVSGKFDDTRGPDMPDFEVVGRSSGSSISIINGVMTQEQQINLTLSPRRPGNLTIGPVELILGGRVVASSRPITIRVIGRGAQATEPEQAAPPPGPQPPSPPAVPEQYAGSRWFLLPRVPERPLYVGEPVYVEYVLFVRAGIEVSDAQIEKPPTFQGVVVYQPSGSAPAARRVSVQGIPYMAHVVWRGALTALGPGRVALPSMSVILAVGDGFFVQRRRVANEPVALDFRPVPTEKRPADYVEGTVGRFVVSAKVDKPGVRLGESAVLTVEVSGAGNLQAIRPSDFEVSEGLRISKIPTGDLDELVVDAGGISGRKVFQYLLTPEREGEFEVGRIEVVFFDPVNEKFDRSRTEPIKIVAVGRGGGRIQEVREDPVVSIVASSDLEPPATTEDIKLNTTFWVGLCMPVAFFITADAIARRRDYIVRNSAFIRHKRALSEAKSRLAILAKDRAIGVGEFFGRLERVLRDFISARFDVNADGLTNHELAQLLMSKGVSKEAIDALIVELEACAFGRFAPTAAMGQDRFAAVKRALSCVEALASQGPNR